MKTIRTKYYPAYVGSKILAEFDFTQFEASAFVVITDVNVQKVAIDRLLANPSLKPEQVIELVLPNGEASKSLQKCEKILRYLAAHNIDRQAVVLAFGGGVVGDISGFVASVYKRGINYIQIPTTLLAQVDSAHGGKTGVNLPEGKNLVGSTNFPLAVIADTSLLGSLPHSELVCGLAEIVKYGVIQDHKVFTVVEKEMDHLSSGTLEKLITKSIKIKSKISEKDPEESEYRKILNYGHTIGHALEVASHHQLSHGQAVALGMIAEAYISNQLGFLSDKNLRRQNNLIAKLSPKKSLALDPDELIKLMRRDKKAKSGELFFVLPKRIGEMHASRGQVAFEVDEITVRGALKYLTDFVNQPQ